MRASFIRIFQLFDFFELIWRERSLIRQLVVRNISEELRGSILGLLWTVFNPLFMLGVYAVVFGLIFGADFGEADQNSSRDYVFGLFLGLSLYRVVADALTLGPRLIVSQPNFVNKVMFPLEVLPLSLVCVTIYHLLVSICLLFVGLLLTNYAFSALILFLPVLVIPVILLALGIAYFVSALGVFLRDLSQIAPVASVVLLYCSGVFYAAARVQEQTPGLWSFLRWNPLLLSIDGARDVLLWGMLPPLSDVLYVWILGIIVFFSGYLVFRRLRPAYADVM